MLLGSIVTSTHDTEEACLGRKEILKTKGVIAECHKEPTNFTGSGSIRFCQNGICN